MISMIFVLSTFLVQFMLGEEGGDVEKVKLRKNFVSICLPLTLIMDV